MRRVLLALAALVAAWLIASVFLFLRPHEDSPGRVDAVVVLAGDADHRIPRGRELVRHGASSLLVLSREPGSRWDPWRSLCRQPRIECFDANPYSTQGEAEAVARLARRNGWRSVAVVSSRYHVFRARMLFRRCLKARVSVVGATYDWRLLPLVLPLETAKLIWALAVDRHC